MVVLVFQGERTSLSLCIKSRPTTGVKLAGETRDAATCSACTHVYLNVVMSLTTKRRRRRRRFISWHRRRTNLLNHFAALVTTGFCRQKRVVFHHLLLHSHPSAGEKSKHHHRKSTLRSRRRRMLAKYLLNTSHRCNKTHGPRRRRRRDVDTHCERAFRPCSFLPRSRLSSISGRSARRWVFCGACARVLVI